MAINDAPSRQNEPELQGIRNQDGQPQGINIEDARLAEAQATASQLINHSLYDLANNLGYILLVQKGLPSFYFNQAAIQTGVSHQVYRYWRTKPWPIRPQQDGNRLLSIVQILLKVQLRLHPYPAQETYEQALERLKTRVSELKKKGYSHNRIAQHLRVPFRTLSDITKEKNTGQRRPRHCPWEMLTRLERAETEISTIIHSHTVPRVDRTADRDHGEPPPLESDALVPVRGNCRKCQASWAHLYPNGHNGRDIPVRTCRICGADNPINVHEQNDLEGALEFPSPRKQEFIERHAPCWHCNAPSHNLAREGQDTYGNTIYTCMICAHVNRIENSIRATAR